ARAGVRPGLLGRVPRDFGVPGLLLAAVVLLLALPYRSVQAELGLRRSLDDWRVLHAASFLAAPTYAQEFLTSHLLPDAHINQTADAYLFPGWTALLLAGVGLVGHRVRSARSALSVAATWTALAADVAMVAAATVAVLVPAHGTLRLKAGGVALLTARAGWRVWAVVALCLVLRIAVGRLPGAGAAERRLFAALTAWCARQWRARTLPFAALVGLSIWLAIGPPFSLWPYVYWLPGFNFVRVSSRFTLLGILGLAVLAGAGAEAATDGLRRRTRAAVVAALAAAVCVECLVPIDAVPYAVRIPDADRWLATQAGTFAIAEVPVPDIRQPGLLNKFQSTYMLHSTAHWQKTVHGWSGLMPDSQLELFDALSHFPDEASIQALQRVQVMYVVVHRSLYSDDDWTAVARQLRTTPQLAVVYSDDSSAVYRVWR
ncbi:MAG: hypothetical protein ABUS56_00210, partial [Acidobacteriota bacterium]